MNKIGKTLNATVYYVNNSQESICTHKILEFFLFSPLHNLSLREKMYRWANEKVVPPLLATEKQAIFLHNLLWESCSKFYLKQCSLKKLILQREYMEMCFHGNQHSWAIKHPFISLYSKYQSLNFICLPVMKTPVFLSLDDIYCTIVEATSFKQ